MPPPLPLQLAGKIIATEIKHCEMPPPPPPPPLQLAEKIIATADCSKLAKMAAQNHWAVLLFLWESIWICFHQNVQLPWSTPIAEMYTKNCKTKLLLACF